MTLAIACLAGWLFHVVMWFPVGAATLESLRHSDHMLPEDSANNLVQFREELIEQLLGGAVPGFYVLLVITALSWHLAHFLGPYRAPINPLGRLLTGRWVIPGYDRVFLAPLAATIVAVLLPPLLGWYGMPLLWRYPLALTVVVLALRNVGPELSDWHLTGEHRLTPGMFVSRDLFLRG